MTQSCDKCGAVKDIEDFPTARSYRPDNKSYKRHICKACKYVAYRKWRASHPEQYKKSQKVWAANNKPYTARKSYEANRSPKGRYTRYKCSAKERDIFFGLSFDEFMAFWKVPCSYCGDKINTIGIDRIVSETGYIPGNVVSCCCWCNRAKNKWPVSVFIERCTAVVEYYGKR